jgi:hypothetical protein
MILSSYVHILLLRMVLIPQRICVLVLIEALTEYRSRLECVFCHRPKGPLEGSPVSQVGVGLVWKKGSPNPTVTEDLTQQRILKNCKLEVPALA